MGELQSGTPTKKQTRSCRQTKEQTDQKIREIYHKLVSHIGRPVILFEKESREMVPYFVVLKSKTGSLRVIASQKCYHPDGGFRCFIHHTVSAIKILTGEQKIVFFDDGI